MLQRNFEIGQILHLKFEIRNPKSEIVNSTRNHLEMAQSNLIFRNFGFEMQDYKERGHPFAVLVDVLRETVITFVKRSQSKVHFVVAWIEPSVDRKAQTFRNVHRAGV